VPLYSAGRRRTILLLLLTSVLLVTIDLRGNAVFDATRSAFSAVFSPLESAADVVTRPITDVWRGITEYDELLEENERLQAQIDAQRGAEIAARNALVENQQLLALNDLDAAANIPSVTAKVIGQSPNNLDQTVEIDRGGNDGVETGMAVVNEAGLVGRITRVYAETSVVMLVTDPQYAVTVKILAEQEPEEEAPATTVESTVPSGLPVQDVTTTTSTTTTTLPPSTTLPPIVGAPPVGAPTTSTTSTTTPTGSTSPAPEESTPSSSTTSTTTTTSTPPVLVDIETGVFEGRGASRLPQVAFIADNPRLGRPQVGDTVHTTGGSDSLAPPDIPVGIVRNVIPSRGSAGMRLEIETAADVSSLQFVRVLLYKPPSEVGG
jgi:rod shape-determining protein MreC